MEVWRQAGGLFLRNHMPLLDEFAHDIALVMGIHENQNIGHQMPILDDLALLITREIGNQELSDLIKRLSPVAWRHVNLIGKYEFFQNQYIINIQEVINLAMGNSEINFASQTHL